MKKLIALCFFLFLGTLASCQTEYEIIWLNKADSVGVVITPGDTVVMPRTDLDDMARYTQALVEELKRKDALIESMEAEIAEHKKYRELSLANMQSSIELNKQWAIREEQLNTSAFYWESAYKDLLKKNNNRKFGNTIRDLGIGLGVGFIGGMLVR